MQSVASILTFQTKFGRQPVMEQPKSAVHAPPDALFRPDAETNQYAYARPLLHVLVLFLATLGLYIFIWFYKNWKQIKKHNTYARISPFWRTVGLIVPVYNLILIYEQFDYINRMARMVKITKTHSPGWCFIMILAFGFISGYVGRRLIGVDLSFVELLNVIPMILVQRTLNSYWRVVQPGKKEQGFFSNLMIPALIILGLWVTLFIRPSNQDEDETITGYYPEEYNEAEVIKPESKPLSDNANAEADNHFDRGLKCMVIKEPINAIAEFTKAINIKPDHVNAYIYRGNAYKELENYKEAVMDYTRAIKLAPESNVMVYIDRADIYLENGSYDKAIADYTIALKIKPESLIAYENRADAYYENGDNDKAIADWQKIIQLYPYKRRELTPRIKEAKENK